MSYEYIRVAADGVLYEGWESIQISWDRFAPYIQFVLTTTEIGPPGKTPVFDKWNFPPGTAIDILAGNDLMLSANVDVYIPQADADQHSITLVGSTKGLVFAQSSIDPNKIREGRFTNLTDNQIMSMFAGASCAPFTDYTTPDLVPVYQVKQGATYYQEMMRIYQQRGKTIMGTLDGGMAVIDEGSWSTLGFPQAGVIPILAQGLNIIKMSARLDGSIAQRYFVIGQNSIGTDLAQHIQPFAALATGSPIDCRARVIVDQAVTTQILAYRRALWEYVRDKGARTQAVITTPGWRHTGNNFWSVNEGVNVNAPWLQIDCTMGIIKCVYTQNSGVGTTTELTLVPPNDVLFINPTTGDATAPKWECNSGPIWNTWPLQYPHPSMHGAPPMGPGLPGKSEE